MGLWDQHWYDVNDGRAYPVDDTATLVADDGTAVLPDSIIADMMIKFPDSLGSYVFLSSVTITERLVSLTFQASSSLSTPIDLLPAAVISLVRPVDRYRVQVLRSQYPGVSGYIVFGDGIDNIQNFRARFSSPAQTLITARAARKYKTPPIQSISVPNSASQLTGLVNLVARSPLELARETREIDGVVRQVIVIRLVQPVGEAASVFQKFAGTCGVRPESNTCDKPAIEFIDNVSPDCDGVITLEFRGALEVAEALPLPGAIVDGTFGLTDTCTDRGQLPNADGKLPNEYGDACIPSEVSQTVTGPFISAWPLDDGGGGGATLPYTHDFNDCRAPYFSIVAGHWDFEDGDSPGELASSPANGPSLCAGTIELPKSYSTIGSSGASSRNISLWKGESTSIPRQVITDFRMVAGPPGTKHNAGVVLNYRRNQTQNEYVYYLVNIDYDALLMSLIFFNGSNFVTISSVSLSDLNIDQWYRLTVTAVAGTGSNVNVTAHIQNQGGIALNVTMGPVSVSNYLPSNGHPGLHANRAYTDFSFWKIVSV